MGAAPAGRTAGGDHVLAIVEFFGDNERRVRYLRRPFQREPDFGVMSVNEVNMLTSISIQGFKSLEQVEIPLGCVNVFIGANGSGKSNLLESLGFVSAIADGRLDDQALARRGVRTSAPPLYRSSFATSQPAAEIRIATRFDTADCQLDYTLRLPMEVAERERP
ncbi:MAG: AAA family ATPase, partial [Caldilinea sp.]